jgi:hypothetical protein
MLKRVGILATGLAVIAVSVVILSSSASSSAPRETPVLGYTVIDNGDGTCDLNSIDLATGQLTDLPAPPSSSACSSDLAVAPDGTVYGIDGDHLYLTGSLDAAVDSDGNPHLIEYDDAGNASITVITNDENFLTGLLHGGIAVDADGTIWAQIQDATSCANVISPTTGLYISDSIPMVCLFTIDPVTGVATLVGPSNQSYGMFIGLTSCESAMRTLGFGADRPVDMPNQPASLLLTWSTVDTETGEVIPGSAQSPPPGYDCLTSGDTMFALDWHSGSNQLGTIDLTTGAFNATVALSDPDASISWYSFAVAPPAETTPTTIADEPSVPAFAG